MTDPAALRRALLDADPRLSRFDPLSRIIAFDRGFCGWTQLVGNDEGSLHTMLPGYAQHTHAKPGHDEFGTYCPYATALPWKGKGATEPGRPA